MTQADMTAKKNHHHGDLREALITAGLEIMEESGFEALTLRKCAARAGVSHAAPAHHFHGIISLKAAIIARGHRIFAATMRARAADALPDPMAQLCAICAGYLEFSEKHRALFQLMFQPTPRDLSAITPSVLEELMFEAGGSYGVLRTACEPFESDKRAPNSVEIAVWSMVHGYAMLFGETETREAAPTGPIPDFSIILPILTLQI
ncbi:MAG: TetR/AcrR family transcriptional regulator [Rhodobacteraceae bacterium]|nr:TetR/AcrR family transcriptional regulator [Paracoccaceae bacterium]